MAQVERHKTRETQSSMTAVSFRALHWILCEAWWRSSPRGTKRLSSVHKSVERLCWNHGRMANSKIRMENSSVSSMLLICWQLIEHSNISVAVWKTMSTKKGVHHEFFSELATVVAKILWLVQLGRMSFLLQDSFWPQFGVEGGHAWFFDAICWHWLHLPLSVSAHVYSFIFLNQFYPCLSIFIKFHACLCMFINFFYQFLCIFISFFPFFKTPGTPSDANWWPIFVLGGGRLFVAPMPEAGSQTGQRPFISIDCRMAAWEEWDNGTLWQTFT